MSGRVRGFRRRFRFPWRSAAQIECEVDDELEFHLAMCAEALERDGLSAEEARREALRRFGDVPRARRQLALSGRRGERQARWRTRVEDWWRDLRYGARSLARTPVFTAVAVIVLAVGIGANSAVLSLINAMLVRPMLIEDPDNVVGIYAHTAEPPTGWRVFSYPEYRDLRELTSTFSDVAGYRMDDIGLEEDGLTQRSTAFFVSANYFGTFGVPVAHGRDFTLAEERSGGVTATAVVSHDFWVRNDRDPDMLGSVLRVNGEPVAVVGIAAEGFTGHTVGISPDLWMPLGALERLGDRGRAGERPRLDDRESGVLYLFGRLGADVSVVEATADLDRLASRVGTEPANASGARHRFVLAPLDRFSIGNAPANDEDAVAVGAVVLTGMTGIVLLIACINLANMLLARGAGRRTEMAVRQALGGGRPRLVRQLLLEASIVALGGGVVGLILGYWAAAWLVSSLGASPLGMTAVTPNVAPDPFVLAGTFVSCIVATLMFGLGPALRVSGSIAGVLKEGGDARGAIGGRRSTALLGPRNLLVIAQVGLSLALLTTGGLFLRGALEAGGASPGYDLEPIALAELDTSALGYTQARSQDVYARVLERVRSLPGVERASLASLVPFDSVNRRARVAGADAPDASETAYYHIVSDDYFSTLDLPVLRGRSFTAAEGSSRGGRPVTIIDEPLAERLFGGAGDALGRYVEIPGSQLSEAASMEVVGVVPGTPDPMRPGGPSSRIYVPFGHYYQSSMYLHVRIADAFAPTALLDSIRDELLAAEPGLPVLSLTTMIEHRDASLFVWGARTAARIFAVLGALALFLAVIGVYGVKAFLVACRTREIGVRMALGATRGSIMRQMLHESLRVTVAGLGIGLLLALAIGRVLSAVLYGVSPADPLVLISSAALLTAAATAAAYLATRRATRIDPTAALRQD